MNVSPMIRHLAACVAFALAFASENHSAWALDMGAALPACSLKNVDGNTVSTESFADKKAVVIVFASHTCTYSAAYEDRLMALQNEFAAKGIQFLLINPNSADDQATGRFESMQKRAAERKYPFPYLLDETRLVTTAFGATRIPEVFVFGADQKLLYRGRIDDNTEAKQVRVHDLQNVLTLIVAGTPDKIAASTSVSFGCSIKR
jgi:peroxiredoxin